MPTRAPSPDSDTDVLGDRINLSSSPEPPENPLASVLIGSQSRAAKRGEYVPVPARAYGHVSTTTRVLVSPSKARGVENAGSIPSKLVPGPATRPVSWTKPPSRQIGRPAHAKPPSRTAKPLPARASRPPVSVSSGSSKGKGKARDSPAVIEISDDSDSEGRGSRSRAPQAPSSTTNSVPNVPEIVHKIVSDYVSKTMPESMRPPDPVRPSRCGNVAPPPSAASTSTSNPTSKLISTTKPASLSILSQVPASTPNSTAGAVPPTAPTRTKRPAGLGGSATVATTTRQPAITRQYSAITVNSSSGDESEGPGTGAGQAPGSAFPSRARAHVQEDGAKRRRLDTVSEGDAEGIDRGVPMDVDMDVDMDVVVDQDNATTRGGAVHANMDVQMDEVDAGYHSDATLSYVSDAEGDDEREAGQKGHVEHVAKGAEVEEQDEDEEEEDERPFPDFEALRVPSQVVSHSAKSTSSSPSSSKGTGVAAGRDENAVAGPSNLNAASRSGFVGPSSSGPAGTSNATQMPTSVAIRALDGANLDRQTNSNSSIMPEFERISHEGSSDANSDDAGVNLSPEDAAAVYAAMFGDEDEERLPDPGPSTASIRLDGDVPGEGKGKGKAREVVEAEEGAQVVVAAPGLRSGLARLRAEEQAPVHVPIPEQTPVPAPILKWGAWDPLRASASNSGNSNDQPGAAVRQLEQEKDGPATAEERFVRALRAVCPSASGAESRTHTREGGMGGAEGERDDAMPADVVHMGRAANAFVPERAGDGVDGGVQCDRDAGKGKGKERAREAAEPSATAAAQNAFSFTFPRGACAFDEPPAVALVQQALVEEQQQDQPLAVATPDRDPPSPVRLAAVAPTPIPPPAAVAGPASLPGGAFTFVFPRGGPGAATPHNGEDQARVQVPGAIVVPPRPPPALLVPPGDPSLQLRPLQPIEAPAPEPVPLSPPVRAAPAPVVVPPPLIPVAAPAPVPEVVPAPLPAPGFVHEPPPPVVHAPTREQITERAIAQINEILPDVERGYLLAHVASYVDLLKERTAEHVVGLLLEAEAAGGYPRAVQEWPVPVPDPAPPPAQARPAQFQAQARVHQPQPQPVAGGSNLGAHARGGNARGAAGQQVDGPANEAPVDYEDVNRATPSEAYRRLAAHYLRLAFPYLPKHVVTTALFQHRHLYAPTYLSLHAAERRYTAFPVQEERPYRCNSTKYNAAPGRRALVRMWDRAFGEEWLWVEAQHGRRVGLAYTYMRMCASHGGPDNVPAAAAVERVLARHAIAPAPVAGPARVQPQPQVVAPLELLAAVADIGKGKQRAVEADMGAPDEDGPAEEDGDIECGCCFSEYTFDKMVQCPDAHLFCTDCVSQYAATQLGGHNPLLVCMHSSDCKLPFPESELRRVLTPTLMALFSRLTAQRAVAAAGLEGLEECPFCDWQCVIDAPADVDRLFRCGNEESGCGVVSCRVCKKKDHRPKTCKEIEEDQVLNGQHAIEEAMTRALMRNCPNPKCKKAFVKETGCNKMTCPHCRTLSCYVCRQVIKGYDHFDVMPGAAAHTAVAGRCKLWENVEERHVNEVREAAARAAEELKRVNPELDHEAIKVGLPIAPPLAPAGAARGAIVAAVANHHLVVQHRAAQLRLEQECQLRQQEPQVRLAQEEVRRQQLLREENRRRERERQADRRRREREAQELRRLEAQRLRLQQLREQEELHRVRWTRTARPEATSNHDAVATSAAVLARHPYLYLAHTSQCSHLSQEGGA